MRRRARLLGVLVATLAMLAGVTVGAPRAQSATVIDGFDPGMLISDAHFYASTRMTAAQVQTFLDREGRNCVPGPDGTKCLKDYAADVPAMAATRYCQAVTGGKGWRASRIIADLSRACGINPEVILVMLQKEQSLVYASGSMLNKTRYDKALGSGCPDFQPCDPNAAGFVMQVYSAGERFQKYRQHPERYNYKVGSNVISYHPTGQCGSARVNIRNQATAALYTYTPYVPNEVLISSAGTQSDSCSVPGNLTFYRYLKRWFPGSTTGSTAPPIYPTRITPVTATTAGTTGVGWTANVWGTAQGVPNAEVWTEVRLPDGRWSRSQTGRTSGTGYYALPLTYGRNNAGTQTFRVGVRASNGIHYSSAVTLTRVSLSARTAGSARIGTVANVWGTAAGAPHAEVWTEVRLPDGRWSRSQVRRASGTGYYVIPLTYGQNNPGRYQYRVATRTNAGTVYTAAFTFTRYR
ncbi:MAG: hypothetical protein GXX86_00285 [Propionibacterium sp.]|nr:hypothetical protein [Propionibacterium sp.]